MKRVLTGKPEALLLKTVPGLFFYLKTRRRLICSNSFSNKRPGKNVWLGF